MSFSIDYDIVVNDDNCTDLSKEYSSLAGQLEEKLSIDPAVLACEIQYLTNLLEEDKINSSFEVASKGKAADVMRIIFDYFKNLEQSLDVLISNTIAFLENAEDGFIDADSQSADEFNRLVERVNS